MKSIKIILPLILALIILLTFGMLNNERIDGARVIECFYKNRDTFFAIISYCKENNYYVDYSEGRDPYGRNEELKSKTELWIHIKRLLDTNIFVRIRCEKSYDGIISATFEFKDCDIGGIIYMPNQIWSNETDYYLIEDNWYFFDMNMGGHRP
jgi:hypothetical protein